MTLFKRVNNKLTLFLSPSCYIKPRLKIWFILVTIALQCNFTAAQDGRSSAVNYESIIQTYIVGGWQHTYIHTYIYTIGLKFAFIKTRFPLLRYSWLVYTLIPNTVPNTYCYPLSVLNNNNNIIGRTN
jgi:hypothetical protein